MFNQEQVVALADAQLLCDLTWNSQAEAIANGPQASFCLDHKQFPIGTKRNAVFEVITKVITLQLRRG